MIASTPTPPFTATAPNLPCQQVGRLPFQRVPTSPADIRHQAARVIATTAKSWLKEMS